MSLNPVLEVIKTLHMIKNKFREKDLDTVWCIYEQYLAWAEGYEVMIDES